MGSRAILACQVWDLVLNVPDPWWYFHSAQAIFPPAKCLVFLWSWGGKQKNQSPRPEVIKYIRVPGLPYFFNERVQEGMYSFLSLVLWIQNYFFGFGPRIISDPDPDSNPASCKNVLDFVTYLPHTQDHLNFIFKKHTAMIQVCESLMPCGC